MLDVLTLENLIILAAFVGAFASVAVFVLPFMRRDPLAARAKAVARRREELSAQQKVDLAQQRARHRPPSHIELMKKALESIRLDKLTSSPELKQKLAMAGWRQPSAIVTFIFGRLTLTIGLPLLVFLYLSAAKNIDMELVLRLAITMIAAAIGFYLPSILVSNATTKRQAEMTEVFPDALDLLVICVESGLSIEAAFGKVTEEIAETSPILSQEFGLTTAELAFLGERTKAYTNFAERTGLPAAKSLSTSLSQSETYGTPLGLALNVLSQESREERMAKAERKAGSLPAQLTVPMILFFLPVLFMVILGPAIIQIMNQ